MTDDEPLLISGIAAYRHAPPAPAVQRNIASRAAYEAHMLLRLEPSRSEPTCRRAIELLVDAFLLDRDNNADCFARPSPRCRGRAAIRVSSPRG